MVVKCLILTLTEGLFLEGSPRIQGFMLHCIWTALKTRTGWRSWRWLQVLWWIWARQKATGCRPRLLRAKGLSVICSRVLFIFNWNSQWFKFLNMDQLDIFWRITSTPPHSRRSAWQIPVKKNTGHLWIRHFINHKLTIINHKLTTWCYACSVGSKSYWVQWSLLPIKCKEDCNLVNWTIFLHQSVLFNTHI